MWCSSWQEGVIEERAAFFSGSLSISQPTHSVTLLSLFAIYDGHLQRFLNPLSIADGSTVSDPYVSSSPGLLTAGRLPRGTAGNPPLVPPGSAQPSPQLLQGGPSSSWPASSASQSDHSSWWSDCTPHQDSSFSLTLSGSPTTALQRFWPLPDSSSVPSGWFRRCREIRSGALCKGWMKFPSLP